jgi:phenylpropionate dioxygenase-like ring-hydroxylating dioxygenase large terminal subunit
MTHTLQPIAIAPAMPQESVASHPAGGLEPDRFDWFEAWHPIHYVDDLARAQPTRFTLLERDLVIWWDRAAETWRVFDDRCPHRLAPLSEGRIAEDGLLECPYHGWAFAGDGACDRIPQQPEGGNAHQSARACVTSYPTAVRQGLLFVYPGKAENAANTAVPIIEPLETEPDGWICLNTVRDLPYDALTLLENVLDASHVPFTHHKTVGNRTNAAPVDLEVVHSDKQGFIGTWAEGPRRGQLGRQDTTFIAPSLMWHDLTSKQFGRTMTVVYATPIRPGECRLFAQFPFKFSSKVPALFIKLTPRWFSHIGQNAILEDDQIFLYWQERYLAQQGGSANVAKAFYLPTAADRFVTELRNWVNQFQAEPFEKRDPSPAPTREMLLERYYSHTIHCASCRGALTNLRRIRVGSAVIGAIAAIAMPLLALLAGAAVVPTVAGLTVLTATAAGLWVVLGRVEQRFYVGRTLPPRNLLEKSSRAVISLAK